MSNAIRHTGFIITFLLLTFQSVAADNISNIKDISVTELMSDPKKYDGKQVSVIGHYHVGLEKHTLSDDNGSIIWLGTLSKETKSSDIKEINDSRSRVIGQFVYGRSGHLGMYPGRLEKITRVIPLSEPTGHGSLGVKVKGIVMSEKGNTALFVTRDGKSYIVKEGTMWFPGFWKKKIKRIQKDRVIITEEFEGANGIEFREFIIFLKPE